MRKRFINFSFKANRSGFTVLELIIFAALFTIASIAFLTIMVTVTRVQVRQTGAAEVAQQSQFLLQTVQYYVERSSLVEMASGTASTTLKLRMPSSTVDPTYIYLSGGIVYLKETDSGVAQQLTSDRVVVDTASFTKRENPGGHDSVSVVFSIRTNTTNATQQFLQSLRTGVTRVSAATFDSNVVPTADISQKIGTSGSRWQSINDVVYFDSSNRMGVGISSPLSKLHVSGGDIYVDNSSYGLILKNSGGSCYRLGVSSTGTITSTSITCP